MSDEAAVIESKASAEVQAAAEKDGWKPPAKFKGRPEDFVDADVYMERGKVITPIVAAQNEKLRGELAALQRRVAEQDAAIKASQDALADLEESRSAETARAAAEAKAELKRNLKAAREAGDIDAEMELLDELAEHNAAPPPKKAEEKKVEAEAPKLDPALVEWFKENPWFNEEDSDTRRALTVAAAGKLRRQGDTTTGAAFYNKARDMADAELERIAGGKPSKVESARGGGAGSTGNGKTYADLPREAKEICDADITKFVGPAKRYKTPAEWRAKYAERFFAEPKAKGY